MSYYRRRYHRPPSGPVILNSTKRAAPCATCGAPIAIGARSVWYPAAGVIQCPACFAAGRSPDGAGGGSRRENVDDFDRRVEDQMSAACGLDGSDNY